MQSLRQAGARLGVGGHSYIQELGNDPQPAFEEQCALVGACLDSGIQLFDTTYYQERMALGTVLQTLGRRDQAQISAWNFFRQPGQEDQLVPYSQLQPQHLDVMLAELQTDRLDILVIHAHDDYARLGQELALGRSWLDQGRVGALGLGMVGQAHLDWLPAEFPVRYAFAPYNAFNQAARSVFELARQRGIACVAMSPFVRGWKLDAIGGDTRLVADLLLRWVAGQPLVDHVIVSMRKLAWVRANLESVARGPLSAEEQAQLQEWVARAG